MTDPGGSESALGVGLTWASRCIALALEFALPALIGYGVDSRWGTGPWGVILGSFAGFGLGLVGLLQLIKASQSTDRSR